MILINEKTMSIKYYDQIIRLEDYQIEIKMPNKIICVKGENLKVSYYTTIEVVVHGEFSSVLFQ